MIAKTTKTFDSIKTIQPSSSFNGDTSENSLSNALGKPHKSRIELEKEAAMVSNSSVQPKRSSNLRNIDQSWSQSPLVLAAPRKSRLQLEQEHARILRENDLANTKNVLCISFLNCLLA